MKKIITLFALLIVSIAFAQENTAITCADGIDNDGDGLIDCMDADCNALPNAGCTTCVEGITFADVVIEYNPGCANDVDTFPESTLGVSDYVDADGDTYLYLGEGGSIKLGFTNNTLTNSGDAMNDVFVFEIGPLVENCTLAFRPADSFTETQLQNASIPDVNGDGFYEFGSVGGSTAGFDIDSILVGYTTGQLIFDAIEITDVADLTCPEGFPGADIDAVCALSFEELSVDENHLSNINIYPNATKGVFTIDLGQEFSDITVQILDVHGRIILSSNYYNVKKIDYEIDAQAGIYFLKINGLNSSVTKRIIKE